MADIKLTKTNLRAGTWEGVLTGQEARPHLEAVLNDTALGTVEVEPREAGGWAVRVPVPPGLLSDGFHTVLIVDATNRSQLAAFSVMAGDALDSDLRAEVELLRAELDMLKRAFRRHCLETL